MENLTLYKATELAQLQNFIDVDTGEVDIEGFESSQIVLAEKQRAVVAYIRNQQVRKTMLQAAKDDIIKPLDAEIKRIDTQTEGLNRYLVQAMKSSGTNEIQALDGTFKAKLHIERDESVEWIEGVEIPIEFQTVKEVKTPSKTLVRAAIESGQPVSCARIVKSDRLEIR